MRKRVLGLLAAILIAFSCVLIPVNVLARTETGDESQSLTEEEQQELEKAEKATTRRLKNSWTKVAETTMNGRESSVSFKIIISRTSR